MTELIGVGQLSLVDLNDAIISGNAPENPFNGTLWIDTSGSPKLLKEWTGSGWTIRGEIMDEGTGETIIEHSITLGNIANDNIIDINERSVIKDRIASITGVILTNSDTLMPTITAIDSGAKGELYSIRKSAINVGMLTTHPDYVNTTTQYNNLRTYLNAMNPKPWNLSDPKATITVVKDIFRDKWLQYAISVAKLSELVSLQLKTDANSLRSEVLADISDVESRVTALDTEIKSSFKDGIIEEAEAISIIAYINTLSVEKSNVDNRYNAIYGNSFLAGSAKTALANSKESYNTAHTNLINSINSAIADRKATEAEVDDVDNKFVSYRLQLADLSTKFEQAITSIEDAKIGNINIGGTNLLLNSGFKTQSLESWTNTGSVTYATIDGRNTAFINTSNGIYQAGVSQEETVHSFSFWAKALDSTTDARVGFTNDGTGAFETFRLSTAWKSYSFTTSVPIAQNRSFYVTSQGKRFYITDIKAEKGNKPTDWTPSPKDTYSAIENLVSNLGSLNNELQNLDTYVDGAFKDGIISQAEAQAIEKYLNSLNAEKSSIDNKYNFIYGDIALHGTAKSNLLSAKTVYNSAHTNLINSINTAISGGSATSAQKTAVDSNFAVYRTSLSALSTRFEEAIGQITRKLSDANLLDNPAANGGQIGGWSATGLSVFSDNFLGSDINVLRSSSSADVQNYSGYFKADPSKAYMVSMWLKKTPASGMYYIGMNSINASGSTVGAQRVSNSTGVVGSSNDTNPYFQSSSSPPAEYQQFVAYIMPAGTVPSRMKNIGSGVANNFIMSPLTDRIRIRVFNSSNAGNIRELFIANPTVVEVDPETVLKASEAFDGNIQTRTDLRLTAPLPTSISLDSNGITASTSTSTKFARLDYRGLYIQDGAIDIRTNGSLSNRGVLFDGNGIRGFNSSGVKTFEIDSNGNAMFAGTLSGATGTFSGSLSGATGTFSGTISGGSITSNSTINVTTNLTVGNSITVGNGYNTSQRSINFNGISINQGASILFNPSTDSLDFTALNGFKLDGAQIFLGSLATDFNLNDTQITGFQQIRGRFNNSQILADFNNGVVALNASGEMLRIGFATTTKVWIDQDLEMGSGKFIYSDRIIINPRTTGSVNLYISPETTGEARITATGTTGTYRPIRAASFLNGSSREYKTNIEELSVDAVEEIKQLKVWEYDLIADLEAGITDNRQIGLISEDSPSVSSTDGKSINTYKLSTLHLKATQTLIDEISMLKKELNKLKKENEEEI